MSIRSASNQTTTPGHQIRPQIKPLALRPSSDPTTKSDHQIRTPDYQTTDHYPCLLSFQAQLTQPLEMLQVRCILYGLGQGRYIELWMNLAKHTFHTRSAWSLRTLSGLTVVRLVSGTSRAGKGLPWPFSLVGFLCRCSVSHESSALRNRLGFFNSVWLHLRFHICALSQMDFIAVVVVVVVVFVFTTNSRLVAPIELIYHTSLDSLCARQVKLSSARFNQTMIILRHNLVN